MDFMIILEDYELDFRICDLVPASPKTLRDHKIVVKVNCFMPVTVVNIV